MSKEDGSMSVKSSLSSFLNILSSYNSNVLLAALVFLLLVVLFVLLLHFYARFFWSHSHQDISALARRRNPRRTVTTTRIIPSVPLGGGVNAPAVVAATNDDKGLDLSVISSIPLFVYEDDEKDEEEEEEEECVICLGLWEVGDFGRKIRNCGHGFHVECIDMWLSSHSTCPLCRSPVLAASVEDNLKPDVNAVQEETEVRLQFFPAGEDDLRFSPSLAEMEDDLKTEADDRDRNDVGEGEVRIEVYDEEEINGGGSRGDRRSMSMTSSASSTLMRMLSCSSSSRSERNKVFPSATQDSSK